jgi:hypothetical protein
MKQIWPNYSYSPATNVLTLTGLNIDRDQLLLVTAADRGRIMYNFADSSVTASAFTSGANTALTLVATTSGLTTTAALVIYYDDQVASNSVTGTVELGPTSLNALESITVTMGQVTVTGGLTDVQLRASAVTIGGTVTANVYAATSSGASLAFVGEVAVETYPAGGVQIGFYENGIYSKVDPQAPLPVTIKAGTAQIGSVTASISNFPASTVVCAYGLGTDGTWRGLEMVPGSNRLKVEAINSSGGSSFPISGTVTIGAGTAQIGSVTASISGTVPISISSVTVGNSVTIGSLPAISGTVTANTFALQGTAVTTSNFTSTTASTVLASFNATREVLTIFNEGAGNLHICAGATCTTIAYQVRLSTGDYYEVPNHQTSLTHSAVFATAGTARVCQVS